MTSGFDTKDQEAKYNITVFDLIMTLAARVNASLKQKTPETFMANRTEVKVAEHLQILWQRLVHMEESKGNKPHYSQACDRLMQRINELMGHDNPGRSQMNSQYFKELRNANQVSERSQSPKEKIETMKPLKFVNASFADDTDQSIINVMSEGQTGRRSDHAFAKP